MKKIVLYSCLISFLSCHFGQDKGVLSRISILPSFNMLLLDSTTLLNTRQIPSGKPVLIIYFRPDCPHCQQQTKDFIQNIDALKNSRIYFLASATLEDIKGFALHYHLAQYQNITVGKDHEHSFTQVFRPSSIPYLVIYNSGKQLVKVYDEEVPVSKILTFIHN